MALLGEALKIRREELGMDQAELAAAVGTTQQTVSRWERGLSLPRPKRVIALAQVLDLDAQLLHRFAGYLPQPERKLTGPWHELFERMHELTRPELVLLLDRAWEELRGREGLHPPGPA